jgi:hypothetical protein
MIEPGQNYQIYDSTKFYTEFTPAGVKRLMPTAEKVIYYICSWHFHVLPEPAIFAATGLSCEIITLSPQMFYTDVLIAELQTKTYEVPTLLVIQRILPFQLDAWGLPPTHEQ